MKLANCRSLLFTPANRPERFLKAWETKADALVIDLEDAVALPDKDQARKQALDFLEQATYPKHKLLLAVRINSIQTDAGLNDISAFANAGVYPEAFFFPKVEYAAEITLYDKHFAAAGADNLAYCALIETAMGLQNAHDIAGASQRLQSLAFGGGDLAADLGAQLTFEPMLYGRSRVVQAARAHGLSVLDVPHLDFHDDAGNREEAERAKAMGYTGKCAIHPAQLDTLYDVFTPNNDEVKEAQAIVDTYESAKGNAAQYHGKMIDVPIYKSALRILQIVDKA